MQSWTTSSARHYLLTPQHCSIMHGLLLKYQYHSYSNNQLKSLAHLSPPLWSIIKGSWGLLLVPAYTVIIDACQLCYCCSYGHINTISSWRKVLINLQGFHTHGNIKTAPVKHVVNALVPTLKKLCSSKNNKCGIIEGRQNTERKHFRKGFSYGGL